MEIPDPFEHDKPVSITRQVVGGVIAGLKFVGHQLATSDLTPHEGRLRRSAMPSARMHIPEYPPVHDDTI